MNDILKIASGALIGCLAGVIFSRTYYKKKYAEEAERTVAERISEWYQLHPFVSQTPDSRVEEAVETEEAVSTLVNNNDETYIQNQMELRDYHNYTQHYGNDADISPAEDGDYMMDVDAPNSEELPGPRIMEWEEIGIPGFEEIMLLWHMDEGGWFSIEETDERIDDPYNWVGDCLVQPGPDGVVFASSDRRSIHIINERRGEIYEVVKVRGRSM